MNYSVLNHFQLIRVDADIFERMSSKTEEKEIVLVRVDKAVVICQKYFCIESCWSFLVYDLQGPFYTTPMNFVYISVMVWAQCQL